MPLQQVTAPNIEVLLAEDVVLKITKIPERCANRLYDALAMSPVQGRLMIGTLGQIILSDCTWSIEGPIIDAEGQPVEGIKRRLEIAQEAATLNSDALTSLVMDVLGHLGAVSGNWRSGAMRVLRELGIDSAETLSSSATETASES